MVIPHIEFEYKWKFLFEFPNLDIRKRKNVNNFDTSVDKHI